MPQRIATAPAAQAERELRRALAGVPMGRLTDPSAVLPAGHAADVLGSANLAFTDPAHFAGPGASPGLVIREMPITDQRMQRLLASSAPRTRRKLTWHGWILPSTWCWTVTARSRQPGT
jgi:hypothetical protein